MMQNQGKTSAVKTEPSNLVTFQTTSQSVVRDGKQVVITSPQGITGHLVSQPQHIQYQNQQILRPKQQMIVVSQKARPIQPNLSVAPKPQLLQPRTPTQNIQARGGLIPSSQILPQRFQIPQPLAIRTSAISAIPVTQSVQIGPQGLTRLQNPSAVRMSSPQKPLIQHITGGFQTVTGSVKPMPAGMKVTAGNQPIPVVQQSGQAAPQLAVLHPSHQTTLNQPNLPIQPAQLPSNQPYKTVVGNPAMVPQIKNINKTSTIVQHVTVPQQQTGISVFQPQMSKVSVPQGIFTQATGKQQMAMCTQMLHPVGSPTFITTPIPAGSRLVISPQTPAGTPVNILQTGVTTSHVISTPNQGIQVSSAPQQQVSFVNAPLVAKQVATAPQILTQNIRLAGNIPQTSSDVRHQQTTAILQQPAAIQQLTTIQAAPTAGNKNQAVPAQITIPPQLAQTLQAKIVEQLALQQALRSSNGQPIQQLATLPIQTSALHHKNPPIILTPQMQNALMPKGTHLQTTQPPANFTQKILIQPAIPTSISGASIVHNTSGLTTTASMQSHMISQPVSMLQPVSVQQTTAPASISIQPVTTSGPRPVSTSLPNIQQKPTPNSQMTTTIVRPQLIQTSGNQATIGLIRMSIAQPILPNMTVTSTNSSVLGVRAALQNVVQARVTNAAETVQAISRAPIISPMLSPQIIQSQQISQQVAKIVRPGSSYQLPASTKISSLFTPMPDDFQLEGGANEEPVSSIDYAIIHDMQFAQVNIKRKRKLSEQTEKVDEPVAKKDKADEQEAVETKAKEPDTNANTEQQPPPPSEFSWDEYLEATGSQPVPHKYFRHVEDSLQNGLKAGMKVEVPNQVHPFVAQKTYWVARIIATCGQLLLLRYEGYMQDRSGDFWCNISSGEVHPIGWCARMMKKLQPPFSIIERRSNWSEFLINSLTGSKSIPNYLPDVITSCLLIDRIQPFMFVEVLDEKDPTKAWPAMIRENRGGYLKLGYLGAAKESKEYFYLWYTSWRLHPLGWTVSKKLSLKPPEALITENSQKTLAQWQSHQQEAFKLSAERPLPVDFFKDQKDIKQHFFLVGMKLEAVNPKRQWEIGPATVAKVFNKYFFMVRMDDHKGGSGPAQFVCYQDCPGIFPVNWCRRNGLNITKPPGYDVHVYRWQDYLKYCKSLSAPERFFRTVTEQGHSIQRGMKLEAANPLMKNGKMYVATITKVIDRYAWIHFDGFRYPNVIVDIELDTLFPVGWCEANNNPLRVSSKLLPIKKPKVTVVWTDKSKKPSTLHGTPMSPGRDLYQRLQSHRGDEGDDATGKGSIWIPKVFFNHKCFSGPYLNKGRIAELPKAIGPGMVTLVLKEIMSLLINAAYKPPRVLRELQVENDETAGMNGHLHVMKAKYKGKSYRALVEICKVSDNVEHYLREMCIKLECCPNLVSFKCVQDACLEDCWQLTKTKYTYYYGKKKKVVKLGRPPGRQSNLEFGPKKPGKRRKKRKPFVHRKKHYSPNGNDEAKDTTENMDDEHSSGTAMVMHTKQEPGAILGRLEFKSGKTPLMTRARALVMSAKRTKHVPSKMILPPRERGTKMKTFAAILNAGRGKNKEEKEEKKKKRKKKKEQKQTVKRDDVLQLDSNPLHWDVDRVTDFIKETDCAPLARLFKDQEIDGQALLLLTLPTVQECMELKLGPAIKLCHHIERVKIAFYEYFA